MKKLELHKETLRDLSDETLREVSGGEKATTTCPDPATLTTMNTQSPVCPSGATWFASCESTWSTCG